MKKTHLRQGEEPEWRVLEAKEKMIALYGESLSTKRVENDMIKDNALNWALRRLSVARSDDEFLHVNSIRFEVKWWIKE